MDNKFINRSKEREGNYDVFTRNITMEYKNPQKECLVCSTRIQGKNKINSSVDQNCFEKLSELVRQKDEQLKEAYKRFNALKDDFLYNLNLLKERDKELEDNEQVIKDIQFVIRTQDIEIGEVKKKLEERQNQQTNWKENLQQHMEHFEKYKYEKEKELSDMQTKLTTIHIEMQKRNKECMENIEKENQLFHQMEILNAALQKQEDKVALLEQEVCNITLIKNDTLQELDNANQSLLNLQLSMKNNEQELQDAFNKKNESMEELFLKHQKSLKCIKKIAKEYNNSCAELQELKEKEITLFKENQILQTSSQIKSKKIQDLEKQLIEFNKEWLNLEDQCSEKEKKIEILTRKLGIFQESVSCKEQEVKSLQSSHLELENLTGLRTEELVKLKSELSENQMKTSHLEDNLSAQTRKWQQQYQELEVELAQKYQTQIEILRLEKAENLAKLNSKEEELRNLLSKQETLEKDHETLKTVIFQLKEETEKRKDDEKRKKETEISKDDTEKRKEETASMKTRKEEIASMKTTELTSAELLPKAPVSYETNAQVMLLIQNLNENIGILKSEKINLTSQLQRHQIRISHMERMLQDVNRQPRLKQAEIDRLQFDVTAQARQYKLEISHLKSQMVQREINLDEIKKEADGYYDQLIQRNSEITSLNNELLLLRLHLASKGLNSDIQPSYYMPVMPFKEAWPNYSGISPVPDYAEKQKKMGMVDIYNLASEQSPLNNAVNKHRPMRKNLSPNRKTEYDRLKQELSKRGSSEVSLLYSITPSSLDSEISRSENQLPFFAEKPSNNHLQIPTTDKWKKKRGKKKKSPKLKPKSKR